MLFITIGHSTRPFTEFVALIKAHDVGIVADVRAHPGSLRGPQYGRDALPPGLASVGIEYRHVEQLGGRRRARSEHPSLSGAWRSPSFRAYAEHTASPEFSEGIEQLESWAAKMVVAIMCAEAVPWRCHRSLIADVLVARGHDVCDVLGPNSERPHALPAFAVHTGREVTWPTQARTEVAAFTGGPEIDTIGRLPE